MKSSKLNLVPVCYVVVEDSTYSKDTFVATRGYRNEKRLATKELKKALT